MLALGIALAGGHRRRRLRRLPRCSGARRHRPRRLADRRRPLRARLPRRRSAAWRPATACAAPSGLPRSVFGTTLAHAGLGSDACSASSPRRPGTARIIRSMKPGDTRNARRLRADRFDGFVSATGPNYRETAVHFTVRQGGRIGRGAGAGQAPLLRAPAARRPRPAIRTFGFSPALSVDRRHRRRRHGDRAAALLEAAGDADLAGRAGHGVGGAPVAVATGACASARRARPGGRSASRQPAE